MKSVFMLLLFFSISTITFSQKNDNPYTIDYSYTFSGMKSEEEIIKINDQALQLKNVTSSKVIFKSPQHKYAQLKVTVSSSKAADENNNETTTGPRELKKMLISLGYEPHELRQVIKNK